MNISTSSSDGRKANHHENSLSRSRSPSSGSRSPSSKRRDSGPSPGHFGFPPRGGIDAGSPYGPFNPAALAAMRSIPGYTGLLGASSPPTLPPASTGSSLPLPLRDAASANPDNIPLALYQSPIFQAAMRQQQMQLLASLGGSSNPLLPNPLAPHHPVHTQTPQIPPSPSQVQAAVALLAASSQGNGMSSGGFPPAGGIRRPDVSLPTPDSSSSDTPVSNNAAALAALLSATASSGGAPSSNTAQVDSQVAIKAYHDYLTLTNKLQSEQMRDPPGSEKSLKHFLNSISGSSDKHRSDCTLPDSLTTSNQAVLLMAEQLRREKHSIPTNTTSAASIASTLTSRSSAESTQAKTSMTPFNVRQNLSNQENSLKRDHLPPPYSSSHSTPSPTSPPFRHPIINAEDAKKLNAQLQQQADFVKMLAEGSSNVLQSPGISNAPTIPQNFIGVRSPEDLLPRSHPNHPNHRSAKQSPRSHQPHQQIGSNIVSSNTSPPSLPLGIGDLLPAAPRRRDGRSNRSSESSGGAAPTYNGRDKVFTCKICNRSFGYKHVLQNHERTHTGEKPFECKVCNKRFTRDHHLKTHMRLHTGEKPYNCTHCDRQFVQVANLRRHLRVHTGEKPYKCDLCDARFSDSNQLKAHVLIHKGEKPFSCDKCEGTFRRRHHLMHHVCPMTSKSNDNHQKGIMDQDDRHQRSPPPLLPLPGHLGGIPHTSDESAPKGGRKKPGYMEAPLGSVGSSPDEIYKSSNPFSAIAKGQMGQFDEESLKAMLKAATAIGVAAATGVSPSQSSESSLPQGSLELGLRMLRAAESENRGKSGEYDTNIEEELDSTPSTGMPDTSMKIGSNGNGNGRSRKSQAPKRVRQSPTNYDDEIDVVDKATDDAPLNKVSNDKCIPVKTASDEDEDEIDDNHRPRSSTELEEDLQNEPEDLSSRKGLHGKLVGLSAAIRVKSKRELNRMMNKNISDGSDEIDHSPISRPNDSTSSIGPGDDDVKNSIVSTTRDHEDGNESHMMEVEDDEDEDNKGNTSDTGTATTTSTSELTTGIGGNHFPGASPQSELVAVTATAAASSPVSLHGNNVGGNGGNKLPVNC